MAKSHPSYAMQMVINPTKYLKLELLVTLVPPYQKKVAERLGT